MGTTEETALSRVQHRFAGSEAAVERAYATSASFRGLCRDYLTCADALDRWMQSGSKEAPLRAAEYGELLEELTRELESCLSIKR